jgi:hypothetical protein
VHPSAAPFAAATDGFGRVKGYDDNLHVNDAR